MTPDSLFFEARQRRRTGRALEAEKIYRQLLARWPEHPPAHNNLAQLLLERCDTANAERHLRWAQALAPSFVDALLNHGIAADATGDLATAVSRFARACRLNPTGALGWNNLGNALRQIGHTGMAEVAQRRAVALEPQSETWWSNLANTQREAGQPKQAARALAHALILRPNFLPAVFNRALVRLSCGDFKGGWQDYRARHAAGHGRPCPLPQPEWNGEALSGALAVWGEQGLGDEIMFGSILPDIPLPRSALVVETDPRLVPLIARSFPGLRAVARTQTPQPVLLAAERQIALPDLAGRLRANTAAFPKRLQFLRADPERSKLLRSSLKTIAKGKPLVGVVWRSGRPGSGALRSLSIAHAARLVMDHCVFLNLQHNESEAEACALEAAGLNRISGLDLWSDIDGLAALLSALDLLVSVDTATMHLGAALGVPTWALLPATADWRWGHVEERSLWYSSVRLFRQRQPLVWDGVVERVRAALVEHPWA